MAGAAIVETVLADSRLQALGIDEESFLVNYDGNSRPNDKLFMVLAWMPEETALRGDDIFTRQALNCTIWVHIYHEESTDFQRIVDVLDILDDIILNMIHVEGSDGYTVTCVDPAGRSRDMKDDSYETICRSISYKILSRETASV